MKKGKNKNTHENSNDMASQLMNVLKSDDAINLGTDLTEVVIDAVIKDGLLKDIPFFGSFVKIVKLGVGIRDTLFLQKLARFLHSMESVSEKQKFAFRTRLDEDINFQRRIGENLILLLEQSDDMLKPELIGKLFSWFMSERLTYEQYSRAAVTVNRAYMSDLIQLCGSTALTYGYPNDGEVKLHYQITHSRTLIMESLVEVLKAKNIELSGNPVSSEVAQTLSSIGLMAPKIERGQNEAEMLEDAGFL